MFQLVVKVSQFVRHRPSDGVEAWFRPLTRPDEPPEGGTAMPVYALALAALALGFEKFMESHFGLLGVIGVLMLTVGYRERNVTCGCIGAVMLTMLVLP